MVNQAPSAERPISVAEAAHYGAEKKPTIPGLSQEEQAAADQADEYRQLKAKNNPKDGKGFLESYLKKTGGKELTKQHEDDLNSKFGAGEVKRDSSTGKIEKPVAFSSPEAEYLYGEAQAELTNINNVIQYSEINAEVKSSGKPIATVLSERVAKKIAGPQNEADFNLQREKALDYIINTDIVQEGLPDLAVIPLADRRQLIEAILAADPVLRTKILEKKIKIAEDAKNLPEAPAGKEIKEAEENKKEAGAKVTENADFIKDKLKDLGFDETEAGALRTNIEKYIKDGKSLDQVLGYLRSESLGKLSNIPAIQEYIEAKSVAANLQGKLDGYDITRTIKSVIDTTEKKLQSVQVIIDKFETDANLVAEFNGYQGIVRAFTNQKDNSSSTAEGGIFLSPIANGIDQIVKFQKIILNADKVIKEKGEQSNTAQEAWRADRLARESGLISEMKDVVQSSIAEVLDERRIEMQGLERQRMAGVIENQEKEGKKAIAEGNKKVEEAKAKNWIEDNRLTRKQEVHRYRLGSDGKYAIYAGNDGIKRLLGRDSGLQPRDTSNIPVEIYWKNVDLDTLPEDIKKTLDEIYETQKDSYAQKLLGDFLSAQSFASRTIFGKPIGEFALKKNEYRLLEKNFSGLFEKGINAKAEVKAVEDVLKAKGVKMNGGLLALLALLLAVPASGMKKAFTG